jgi:hypothetical protein
MQTSAVARQTFNTEIKGLLAFFGFIPLFLPTLK